MQEGFCTPLSVLRDHRRGKQRFREAAIRSLFAVATSATTQLPHSATGPVSKARHSQFLQRLPCRQVARMGGGVDRGLAWNERKGLQKYAQAFQSAWTEKADAAALLTAVASDGRCARICPRQCAARTWLPGLAFDHQRGAEGACGPRSDGADRRPRHARKHPRHPAMAPRFAAALGFSRGVRIRAASLLAAVPTTRQPPADREQFERAAAEFIAAQRLNADRPEARATLGNFLARRGFPADAEIEYKAALRLSPQYAPAVINLADLYRQLARDGEGKAFCARRSPPRHEMEDWIMALASPSRD